MASDIVLGCVGCKWCRASGAKIFYLTGACTGVDLGDLGERYTVLGVLLCVCAVWVVGTYLHTGSTILGSFGEENRIHYRRGDISKCS